MDTRVFRMKGWFEKKGQKMEFTKEMLADTEDRAVERLYSDIGSKHGVKRNLINITNVKEINPEEAEDQDIRALAEEE